jgi:hypothetical protein
VVAQASYDYAVERVSNASPTGSSPGAADGAAGGVRAETSVVGHAKVSMVGLLEQQPDRPFPGRAWIDEALQRHWPAYADASASASGSRPGIPLLLAWGVGSVVSNETLVQSRPLVREGGHDFLDDFLRAAGRATIGVFAQNRSVSAPRGSEVARYQRWVGVCRGVAALEGDVARKQALSAALPEFLTRGRATKTTEELAVFCFLQELHKLGELGAPFASPDAIGRALLALDATFGDLAARLDMMVFDGRTFGMLHRRGALWLQTRSDARARRAGAPPTERTAALLVLDSDGAAPSPSDDEVALGHGVFTLQPTAPFEPTWHGTFGA